MDIREKFLMYAGDFEKTLADDDWSRLQQYFCDDALYEVRAQSFGCKLEGPKAIFKGIKKSLDGFDRKFAGRDINLTSVPQVEGDEMRTTWEVTYHQSGWSDFILRGKSLVRYRDGKIAYMCDSYDPSVERELADWQQTNGVQVDASYV
jgi:hypothetical protein